MDGTELDGAHRSNLNRGGGLIPLHPPNTIALTCNKWADADADLPATACSIVTLGACTPSRTLTENEILILLADLLRQNVGPESFTGMTSDELEQVVENAKCAIQDVAIPSMDRDKLVAVVLHLANEYFCSV